MRNARLDEAQAGIKTARRNIDKLRYADGTIFMVQSEKKLKSFLIKVKEESEKDDSKLDIQKAKIMTSDPITSWQIDGETMKIVTDFIFLSSKITADGNSSYEIKDACSLGEKEKTMTNLDSILKSREIILQQRSIYSKLWFYQ